MDYQIDLRRSKRKSVGLEIKEPGVLIVRVPFYAKESEILEVIRSHEAWIVKHMEKARQDALQNAGIPKYTDEEINAMADRAMEIFPAKVEYYARILGVTYNRITIRNQKTRWGSCSSKGNLNFNCLLMQVPEEVLDYVIVHELCHRREMNHSQKFWALVESVLPDYKKRRRWLKENGAAYIQRL